MSSRVLYFTSDQTIPDFMNVPLSLMVGAGDLNHNDIPNVEFFSHNVFFCNAWDVNGSFQENIDWLERNNSNKIICVVDYNNMEQRQRFINTFKGKFYLIDGHGGHVPHFTIAELEKLLMLNGEAVNIHEKSETMIKLSDMEYFLTNGNYPGYIAAKSYLTARIYVPGQVFTQEQEDDLHVRFTEKIQIAASKAMQISIQTNILENLSLLRLSDLQQIMCCLLYENEMPLNMKGHICMNMRIWQDTSQLEIVLKKIDVDFFEDLVANLENKADQAHADRVIEAIRRDMARGDIYGQHAKYRTLKLVKN